MKSCGTNRLRSEALNRLQGLLPIVAAKEVGLHRQCGFHGIKMGKFAEKGWKSGISGGMKSRIIPNYFRNHLDGHVFGHPGIFQFETRPNGEFWRGILVERKCLPQGWKPLSQMLVIYTVSVGCAQIIWTEFQELLASKNQWPTSFSNQGIWKPPLPWWWLVIPSSQLCCWLYHGFSHICPSSQLCFLGSPPRRDLRGFQAPRSTLLKQEGLQLAEASFREKRP